MRGRRETIAGYTGHTLQDCALRRAVLHRATLALTEHLYII